MKQIELGDEKTASLRFANLNSFNAIICRIDWPYKDGLIIPFDSIDSKTECSHEDCTCQEEPPLESEINSLDLCTNCLKAIHRKILEFIDTDPEYSLARTI